ncbi:MAG: 50S ribosomal protein L24, partial [Myxococcales bacterium]|nr:50S ribosomal protein L24 [Myxococcales bacterium]
NLATKHVKVGQTQRGTKTGGIEQLEAPIHISNVALVDPDTKAPARVGTAIVDGEKQRVYKKSRYTAKPEKPAAKKSTSKKSDEAAEAAVEEN